MAFAAAAATVTANTGKIAAVTNAVASLDAQGWTWFGLACEGGGRRNDMTICNALNHDIELVRYYLHWGKVKVPPEPILQSKTEDHALFHNAGSWAATGSSGIVTYKLQYDTYLHYMWDCPFNFDYSDNFIGLMLTSDSKLKNPDQALFNNMYMDGWTELKLGKPGKDTYYDLVCCGPSNGDSHEEGGEGSWGCRRPCKVTNEYYEVLATMGDRHATTSKVVFCHKPKQQTDSSDAKGKSIATKDEVLQGHDSKESKRVVTMRPKPQLPMKPELQSTKPCEPTAQAKPRPGPTLQPTIGRPVKPVKPIRLVAQPVTLPHNAAVKNKQQDVKSNNQLDKSTGCFTCFRLKSIKSLCNR